MALKENIIRIWKARNQILEGITNAIFKKEDVELIATERLVFCRSNVCGYHDPDGISAPAVVKGSESCGSCGCKLAWATRSLSYSCPQGHWHEVLTETEEATLKEKLGINDD